MATKPASKTPRPWYPDQSVFGSYKAWDAHRRALDRIGTLEAQVQELLAGKASESKGGASGEGNGIPKSGPGSVSATHIAGLLVKAVVPQDGQVLKYKAASGQIEWS